MNWLFRERLSSKYSRFAPEATNSWWGLCCCETPTTYLLFLGATSVGPSVYPTSSERYTTTTNLWAVGSAPPAPGRISMACNTLADNVYATYGSSTTANIADNDRYTISTAVWTSMTNGSAPNRTGLRGGIYGSGVFYICGGLQSGPPVAVMTQNDKYTESSDTWGASTALPAPARENHTMTSVENFGYAVGGRSAVAFPPTYMKDIDQFDLSAETWTSKTDVGVARYAAGSLSLTGKLYFVCGIEGVPPSTETLSSKVEEYDPGTNAWTLKTAVPPARDGIFAVSDHTNEVGYIGGRLTIIDHDAYTPDTWTAKQNLPAARQQAGAG